MCNPEVVLRKIGPGKSYNYKFKTSTNWRKIFFAPNGVNGIHNYTQYEVNRSLNVINFLLTQTFTKNYWRQYFMRVNWLRLGTVRFTARPHSDPSTVIKFGSLDLWKIHSPLAPKKMINGSNTPLKILRYDQIKEKEI